MNSTTDIAVTEETIADYLLNHPEFFERHADTLSRVQLLSSHGPRAVSLQERQAEMLREKIRGLEHRIMEMMRHSGENVSISDKLHAWSCALARVQDLRELPHVLTASLQNIFEVPQVALRLWGLVGTHTSSIYTMGVSEDAKSFAASLTMPFCGPNMGFEPGYWLADPDAAQSLALLTLHDGDAGNPSNAFGMLVLGSPDPLRFEATMGTEFLSRISSLASAALSRMRPATLTLARI